MIVQKIVKWCACGMLFCSSCTSVSERSISVAEHKNAKGIVINAKVTATSNLDPDGGSRRYYPEVNIHVFGPGRDMSYRNRPGTVYRFGKEFDVDVDYCNAGYLWLSVDQKQLGVALFDVNPPVDVVPSDFNGQYPLTADQSQILGRMAAKK